MAFLNDSFLAKYAVLPNPMTTMGEVTYWRTYSRSLWEEGRKEQWWETAARVVEGTFSILHTHCAAQGIQWNQSRAERTAREMYQRIYTFKFTPPGRGLYAMGTDSQKVHGAAVLNNCGFLSTHFLTADVFAKLMDLSMLGVGVGYDTLGSGKIYKLTLPPSYYAIPDTREGWVESVKMLLDSYLKPNQPPIEFMYGQIRSAGVPIKRFGGVSSGPDPLKLLHIALKQLCDAYADKAIDSEWIVDCANLIGRCVVSGNVRRSAQIALGHATDNLFLNLKTDATKVTEYRAFSNNSIFAHIGMDYRQVSQLTAEYGEPGYFWLDNCRAYGRMNGQTPNRTDFLVAGTNPCSEQSLEDNELCCLVETYPAHHRNLDDYLHTLKLAYLYAKSVTLLETGFASTDAIIKRNRRIGCSMSGVVQSIQKFGASESSRWCNRGYDFLTGLDASYSDWLQVPESIKRTSIKPSGTVSILANASPGIHYPHAEYYIRRIRIQAESQLLPALEQAGYTIVPDIYGQEKGKENTMVAEFPVHEENFLKGKQHATMFEQLALAAMMQRNWADNQVSVTIHFTKDEARDIPLALEIYQHHLKSVSFLPYDPHTIYPLAPYEDITKEAYGKRIENLKPLVLPYNCTDGSQVLSGGCDGDTCEKIM